MPVRVRQALADDAEALAALFVDMQAHYRVPCPDRATIAADLRSPPPGVTLLMAETDAPVGFAALAAMYPGPGLRKGLFLKELYVVAPARGQGVGRALLKACAAVAVRDGFARIDWTASRSDQPLLAFYATTDATPIEDKLFFRLSGDALSRLAAS